MIVAALGTIDELIEGLEFTANLFIGLSFIAVFILRVTHPKAPRIFSVSLPHYCNALENTNTRCSCKHFN